MRVAGFYLGLLYTDGAGGGLKRSQILVTGHKRCMHVSVRLISHTVFSLLVLKMCPDTASPDDSTEISFSKGEILDIMNNDEEWWQARKGDGTLGST